MKARPLPIRLNKSLYSLLAKSAKAMHLSKQELLRRALRLYVQEIQTRRTARLTNVKPWRRGTLAKAYSQVEQDWDRIEEAATKAQNIVLSM